ncbi:MAG: chemotaxis protein CheW [Oscillospiraceae bacterium]|jgi:purine-binding chemotaxis protein CheW|nr:chemotaxis protein CheW [Oscillospiraceae bacterium]
MEMTNDDAMRGLYLCFRVSNGEYGIEISYVTEIIEYQDITHVPNTHNYVTGIINMRGTIVPVIDMCSRFNQGSVEITDRTCIVVLTMDDVDLGLIVDEVQEVLTINDSKIQPPPKSSASTGYSNEFIKAIGTPEPDKDGNISIKQLLDINKIFEVDEALQ